jgi:hypothetical protein
MGNLLNRENFGGARSGINTERAAAKRMKAIVLRFRQNVSEFDRSDVEIATIFMKNACPNAIQAQHASEI